MIASRPAGLHQLQLIVVFGLVALLPITICLSTEGSVLGSKSPEVWRAVATPAVSLFVDLASVVAPTRHGSRSALALAIIGAVALLGVTCSMRPCGTLTGLLPAR